MYAMDAPWSASVCRPREAPHNPDNSYKACEIKDAAEESQENNGCHHARAEAGFDVRRRAGDAFTLCHARVRVRDACRTPGARPDGFSYPGDPGAPAPTKVSMMRTSSSGASSWMKWLGPSSTAWGCPTAPGMRLVKASWAPAL